MTIRVASWNIRKAVGLDWRRDPHRVARVISGLGAGIVALQESDRRLGRRPAALPPEAVAATGLQPLDLDPDGPSLGWHGNAVLLGPGWRAAEIRTLTLPGLEPRGAVIARLDGPAGGLTLVACHLGLRRPDRRRQLAAILAELADPARAVLMGDLNEWSRHLGAEPLTGRLTLHAPGLSFHAARPVAPLDRIATGAAFEVARMGVARTPDSRRASDHLPVWADLLGPAPQAASSNASASTAMNRPPSRPTGA